MTLKWTMTTKLSLTLLTMILSIITVTTPIEVSSAQRSWRYLFPFFPEELDILIGHLKTTVTRLEEVLEQCEDMIDGEWEGEDTPIGVMALSAADSDDSGNGNGDDDSMEEKVDRILELREEISELEDKIEECSEVD